MSVPIHQDPDPEPVLPKERCCICRSPTSYWTSLPTRKLGAQVALCLQLVMSALIGRPLRKGESVHHRNGVRSDNSPHNLELRTTAHPQGQTLQDMIRFCEQYLEDYGPVWDILKQISSLPPTPPGQ